MKLEVFGSSKTHFSGSGEYDPVTDPALAFCPFCGGRDLVVENTHTPCYTVECQTCGAQGPSGYPNRGYGGGHIKRRADCERLHREAFAAAIAAWNGWQRAKRAS